MAVGYVFKHQFGYGANYRKETRPAYAHLKIKGINCLGLFNIEYEKDEERMLKEFRIGNCTIHCFSEMDQITKNTRQSRNGKGA